MIFVRVDANEYIATGHMMRCLSIADAAKKFDEDTTFILADDKAKCIIENRGYKTIVLQTPWNDMEREIERLVAVIKEKKITKLLVDSYQVTEKYFGILSKETKVAYIDDLGKGVYPVDVLICYAAYVDNFDYPSKYQETKLLLGTKFVPLRQEFCGLGNKVIRDEIFRVLVLSGGADQMNVLQQILDVMVAFEKIHVDAICGIYNSNYSKLAERYFTRKNISIHRPTDNIITYMKSADVAISAAGTTLYELCACGTPTISYVIADNQIDNVTWFTENNVVEYAGDARTDDVGGNLIKILLKYRDREYRKRLSQMMQSVVDGYGAERIAENLILLFSTREFYKRSPLDTKECL